MAFDRLRGLIMFIWFSAFTVDRSQSATTVRRVTPPREEQSSGIDDGKIILF